MGLSGRGEGGNLIFFLPGWVRMGLKKGPILKGLNGKNGTLIEGAVFHITSKYTRILMAIDGY